jgi:hypothetical protein
MDVAARREERRRGVVVTPEEVRAAVDRTRRQIAERLARRGERLDPGKDPLDVILADTGSTLADFTARARDFLALQRMAREDLGGAGEVPAAQVEIWLRDLLRKAGATTEPADLGPGEVARLGKDPVTFEEAGRVLARSVRRTEIVGIAYELAFGLWIGDLAGRDGVVLDEKDVDAWVDRLRRRFRAEPGVEGTGATFEEWLRDLQGRSLAELRADPAVRADLLARKVAAADVGPEEVREEWERNRARYGETARVRRVVVHGEDRPGVFGAAARPMAEARRIADEAHAEIVAGRPFETVARKYSEDFPPDGPRGQPLVLAPGSGTANTPQDVVDAVFRAKEGDLLGPLKAVDGWYLVKVERRLPAPSFEECADRVLDDLVLATVQKWRVALRSDPEVRVAADL